MPDKIPPLLQRIQLSRSVLECERLDAAFACGIHPLAPPLLRQPVAIALAPPKVSDGTPAQGTAFPALHHPPHQNPHCRVHIT